jgi:hypothetical protein
MSAGAQSKIRVRGSSSVEPNRGSNKITALSEVSHRGRIRLNLTRRTSYPTAEVQQSRALRRVEVILQRETTKIKRIKTIATAHATARLRNHGGMRHHRKRRTTSIPVSRPSRAKVRGTCMCSD